MKQIKWDERDYKWLIFILLGIIGLILTWRLNDNASVVNIISMIASGSSIALAVMAMIQSTIYNDRSNDTYMAITEKLSKLEHNTDDIKKSIMDKVNTVIEKNDNIDEETKEELQFSINKVISTSEEVKRRIQYSQKIINRFIKRFRRMYNVELVEIKDNKYGVQGYVYYGDTKLEIYVTHLDYPDIFDDVNVPSFLNAFLNGAKENNRYMILICDGLTSEIHDIAENSSQIFMLIEDDVMKGAEDDIARSLKLPFKRYCME